MALCARCNDFRHVYSCDWYPRCGCPGGTTAEGCNGRSVPCPDCATPAATRSHSHSVTVALPTYDDEPESRPVPGPAEVLAGLLLIAVIVGAVIYFILQFLVPR